MEITSINNERVKYYKKLQEKKYRKEYNRFLVEGEHLVKEALECGIVDEVLLIDDIDIDCKKVFLTKEIMKKISMLETPSNIMAVCHIIDKKLEGNKILLLDNIQDPGNLGTIIRSAVAFSIDTIILSEDTVDCYNSKVIRGSQGMLFKINVIRENIHSIIDNLKEKGYTIYGTKVDGGTSLKDSSLNKDKFVIIMGNEGEGVSFDVLDKCDKYLYIKTNEKTESLNVGVAASIILYEFNN